MSEFHNPNLKHSFPIKNSKKPLIPANMRQHIVKQIKTNKLKANPHQGPSIHNIEIPQSMITPFYFDKSNQGDVAAPFFVDKLDDLKERLTSPRSIAFDERIQKVGESLEPTFEPFMRHVIYLTQDTLAEAFALLNRVSAARHLFDANISAELKEDQDKSLWYLEVVV